MDIDEPTVREFMDMDEFHYYVEDEEVSHCAFDLLC